MLIPLTFKSFIQSSDEISIDVITKISYFNNSAATIYIDGSAKGVGAHNWSWAAIQPWCSGNGSENNPYIIENLKINGNNASSCIEIVDSNEYFVVRNCTLYNSSLGVYPYFDAGLKLFNVSNGMIFENNCSYNEYNGISLNYYCNNNIICDNVMHNNSVGISLSFWSSSNSVLKNEAYHNIYYGICLIWGSNSNNVTDNIAWGNGNIGIAAVLNSNFNRIENNIISENLDGISVGLITWNCTIINNQIYENLRYGICIFTQGDNNTILLNSIINNKICGINITSSERNLIYLNSLVSNGLNAIDDGVFNAWDNKTIGNFWHDYAGNDAGNGTGNVPYYITGTATSLDNHPIIDSIPSVDLIVNTTNIMERQFVRFNCEASGGNGHLSFLWDFGDGCNNSIQDCVHKYTVSGNYSVTLKVMDINDNSSFESISIIVEIDTKPVADFFLNESNIKVGKPVLFTYNGTQGNDPLNFEWDFGDNTTSSGRFSEHKFNMVGNYEVKLTVTDRNGDSAIKTISLKVRDISASDSQLNFFFIVVMTVILITIGISVFIIGVIIVKRRNGSLSKLPLTNESTNSSATLMLRNLPNPNDRAHKVRKNSETTNELQFKHSENTQTRLKEIEETESQMGIEKPKIMCVVHKGPIIGPSYICPKCEAFYCMNCARVLKKRGEPCWSCKLKIHL